MKKQLIAAAVAALLAMPQLGRAEDITRFAPLKADELSPSQKAWAEMIAPPPRNAKITNPPYRAYVRNPDLAPRLSALSDYLRWHTSLPPRLSELAILNAALAQGMPMMVIAMMIAAITQAAAIHRPPNRIQRMFSKIETAGMGYLRK